MINKTEIDSKAIEFEINQSNVERDYVFGWILFGIFTASSLKEKIFLKGGNALRKGYFENTRFSSDLDFGIPDDINQDDLLGEINKICDFIQEKSGIKFIKDENIIKEKFLPSREPIPGLRVYEGRIYFKDFYGNSSSMRLKISMDITRFDKVLLPIQERDLIHPYSDYTDVRCKIRCMKLEEIIATKLKCLMQRQHAPDLFDYVYSVKLLGGDLNKNEVVETLIKKTIFERNPIILKDILIKTSFEYFREYWTKTVVCAKQFMFGVDEAISIFTSDLESIFQIYPDNGYVQFAYFSPELRVPIMDAGRSQTLLKIRYKGEDRMVEPYSLKYLKKRDGSEREYLYVYDRGGGSGESLKSFIAERIELIENTDEKFEPRHIIELCKAGEKPEKPYLFDPNRPLKRSSRVSLLPKKTPIPSTYLGPKYVYQCGFCGKKITKRILDGKLGKHKNKNGFSCPGSSGYYVDTKY